MLEINKIYLGDCLELMKEIPDKSIDMILCDYKDGLSMRKIAKKYNTNHKLISRILKRNNIEIKKPKGKPSLKFSNKKDYLYNNMMYHLKYSISLDWLRQFEDINKLKLLNKALSRKRDFEYVDDDFYKSFVEKFYKDEQFNKIYDRWIITGFKYLKPSLDHINPKSNGCKLNDLDNLQFLTWFENRAKNNMSQTEWNSIKENIGDYLV